jgi:archaellum component FlaC
MGGIRIPKVLMSNKKRVKALHPSQLTQTHRKTKPYISLVELGIPNDLNIFRQSVIHTSDGIFDTIAETTLDDVRREFFNINQDCVKKGYTKDYLISIANKYEYLKDLRTKEKGIYSAIRRMGIENEAFEHMIKLWSEKTEKDFYNFIKENKIKTKSDLWEKGSQYFNVAKRLGINIDEILPNTINKDWTEERIRDIVKQYDDLTTFCKELPSAYSNAKKLGILDEISKHMTKPTRNTPYNKKDIPDLINKIKKAKSRNEARSLVTRSAYDLLSKYGLIKKLFPNKIVSNQFIKIAK